MYIVSRVTITRYDRWDDRSATDDHGFDNLDEARAFYASIDIRDEWTTEWECRPIPRILGMDRCVFAKELYEYDAEAEEYGDTLEYDEYTIDDYRRDNP